MAAANMRPGDWMCPSCSNHNFASRAACNKCGNPKEGGGGCGGYGAQGGCGGYGAQGGCGGYGAHGGCGGYGGPPPAPSTNRFSPYVAKAAYSAAPAYHQQAAYHAAPAPAMGAQQNMRPGDWTCRSCNNMNFASRDACNKCQIPKNTFVAKSGMRDGDWVCPSCANHNFANKVACNKCQLPKDSMGMSYAPPHHGGGGGGGAGATRPGDWICPGCGINNFANKTACFKCQEPKDDMGMHMPAHHEPPHRGGGGGGFGGGGDTRPGDWTCPACGINNFANKTACFKCQQPKDDMGMSRQRGGGAPPQRAGGMRPGDWMCPACDNHNFANKQTCNRCSGPRVEAYDPYDEPAYHAPAPVAQGSKGAMRPGDWMCPSCNNHNFANRDICNKCPEVRP